MKFKNNYTGTIKEVKETVQVKEFPEPIMVYIMTDATRYSADAINRHWIVINDIATDGKSI